MALAQSLVHSSLLDHGGLLESLFLNLFIYVLFFSFWAMLGLPCFVWAFSCYREWELLSVVMCGLLIALASLVRHGL